MAARESGQKLTTPNIVPYTGDKLPVMNDTTDIAYEAATKPEARF